jgi:hypothetical protein
LRTVSRAQLELVCDLLGRAPTFQEAENLDLSGSQDRIRRRIVRLVDIRDLPEDPDDAAVADECARGRIEPTDHTTPVVSRT